MSHYFRMGTSPQSDGSGGPFSSTSTSRGNVIVDPSTIPAPATPDSVRDLGAGVCYDVGAFRELMRQYRSLDDAITTRLNRTLAQSRSTGKTHSPTLLYSQDPHTSRDRYPSDLGTTTYAKLPEEACLDFWKELKRNWMGRELVISYCLRVTGSEQVSSSSSGIQQQQVRPIPTSSARDRDLDLLDADRLPESLRPNSVGGKNKEERERVSKVNSRPIDEWDARGSRAEHADEALRRSLRTEQGVDRIVRNRSLQAFKARCSLFRLPPNASEEDQRLWRGDFQ